MLKDYMLDFLGKILIQIIDRKRSRDRCFAEIHSSAYVDCDVYISDPEHAYLGENSVIYRGTKIFCSRGKFELGSGSHLSGDVYINAVVGTVKIGRDTAVGPKTVIVSHSNDYCSKKKIVDTYKTKDISIGDDVLIGAGVIILPGVVIGDRAVIGAGTVVTKNIACGVVFAGVPGRVIGSRDSK